MGRGAGWRVVGIGRYRTNTITHAYTFLAIHPSKEGDSLRSYSFFLEGDYSYYKLIEVRNLKGF